jgi:hypothetical protein
MLIYINIHLDFTFKMFIYVPTFVHYNYKYLLFNIGSV